jgi:hypothetical protein
MKEGDEIVAFGYTDYGGSFGDKVAIEYFKENHPKNIVFEGAAYNGQNGIVFGEVAKEFLEETKDYPLGYEDMESFYYQMQNAQEEKDFKLFLSDIKNKYTIKKEALDWLLENKSGYYSIEPNGIDFSYSELENELEKEGLIKRKKMADGGMMAKGGKLAEFLVTLTDKDGFEDDVVVMAKSEDDAVYQAEKIRGYESSENGVTMLTDYDGNKIEYSKGGKTQGYDDKEDERLGMEHGKLASKDFIGSRKHRKHSRRDDAQFEERGKMAKGGEIADINKAKKSLIAKAKSKGIYENFGQKERRLLEDKYGYTPAVRDFDNWAGNFDLSQMEDGMMAKGGKVGHSKEDKARFAKPAGWRWKEIAVTKRIIERKQLSMQPSKKMRDKYPDYVYYEDRLNKADKKPSRKYLSE